MKVVILAGGYGTRLSEETILRPKPMVEIGQLPILWHIMKTYSFYGFNDFVLLLGYKGSVIRDYFANFFIYTSDVTIDLSRNKIEIHSSRAEPWKVTMLDTGLESMTGGRLLRAKEYLKHETFLLTYGDGLSDVNLNQLLEFHNSRNNLLTLTAVQPAGRYGSLQISGDVVKSFWEKPKGDRGWVNGGFFVCDPRIFDYILDGDSSVFEGVPMEMLSAEGKMGAFMHRGFWMAMDTLRDKLELERLWKEGKAPWRVWGD